MGDIYLRKYGAATTVDFSLYKADGTGLKTDAASASGDVTLYRDEAAVETLDADAFTDEGAIYSLALSATEMQAARIIVCIVDQTSPQVWLDKTLIVETYGNASAQHEFDLDTATQGVNVTQIGGAAQSATDLKDFADTGYDPASHKVQGLVLCDLTTTTTTAGALGAQAKLDVNAEVDTALNTAIPAAPTADSVNERLQALDISNVLVSTTIAADDRSTTTCRLTAGSDNDDMYNGNIIVLDSDSGDLEYVARTITDYTGLTKKVTFSPAIKEDAVNGGKVFILPNDTTINPTTATILADTNELQTDWVNGGRLDLLIDGLGTSISALNDLSADDVWDEIIEGASPTARQAMRLFLSALASKVSGVGTGTETFRDFGDTKNRIVATIDANNNRTALALDAT